MKILDLGCGNGKLSRKNIFPDYNLEGEVIGLDFNKGEEVDGMCDLNKGKLPFKNNSFDIVYTSHCLEHIQNIVPLIYEVHRILKGGGKFLIAVPHLSYMNSLGDLTHVRLFGWNSFDFCIFGNHMQIHNKKMFKLIKRKIVFGSAYKKIGIESFANKHPEIYNDLLMGIFTAREIIFELEKK